ncbi:MAG: NTP transferase domain-containing protein [Bacteroidaceae bacterium]|nr:NTP transferase domain-containing protein [Bacteroidaceae bacterium]
MNIFILAAGLGTRLKPLTDTMPKALVPVGGRPLLQILIEKIKRECNDPEIVINIHHFAEQIIGFVEAQHGFDIPISFSDERSQLLETGGGLRQSAPLFNNSAPILIHNVDILSNVHLGAFYQQHADDSDVAATLIVSQRTTNRYLLFDDDNRLVGWTNIATGEVRSPYKDLEVERCRKFAFSGIHIVSQSLLPLMDKWPARFPIMDFYLSVCDKVVIRADIRHDLQLLDVGKLDSLTQAETMVQKLGL